MTHKIFMPIVSRRGRSPHPKKALACAEPDFRIADSKSLSIPASYRWLIWRPNLIDEFGNVPMLWGRRRGNMDLIADFHAYVPGGYDDFAIFLNEPDLQDQANLTPSDAADLFREMCDYADASGNGYENVKWIAPNISHADIRYYNCNWLTTWLSEIQGWGLLSRIARLGFHWYDYQEKDPNWALQQLYDAVTPFGLEGLRCWVTEFGCNRNYSGYRARFEEWGEQLLNSPKVEKVFFFTNRDAVQNNDHSLCALDTGELTDIGEVVRGW